MIQGSKVQGAELCSSRFRVQDVQLCGFRFRVQSLGSRANTPGLEFREPLLNFLCRELGSEGVEARL